MTLAQMLEQAGLRRPAADAVVDGRRRSTYPELVDQATRLGHAFARLGVGKGADRRVGPGETVLPGEKGEIIACLDSDEAFSGYWKRPDADARALREGWYFTGDMGYLDAEGELYVSGRVDDMTITGGENVHPVEVEDVLARHPLARDVAVVGEPDEGRGERVVAFVVPRHPRADRRHARPALPRVPGPRELQAAKEDRLRERDPEDGLG